MDDYLWWRGHRIHVKDLGQGDPLLLISGLGSNTGMWRPLRQRFENRRIIRFDAPGTGLSSTPMFPVPIASLADLAVAVLDHLGVESADVIGYSYGGAVAQQLAYDHPDRIQRLVLAATTCGLGATPGSLRAMSILATPLRYYSPSYFNRTAAISFGGLTGRDAAVRHRMIFARRRQPPTYYGYAMQILGAAGWTSWHFLERIQHETLVLCGDDDPLVPVANAELLARRIPRATLEVVEHGGHLFLWDDAVNMAARISEFIDATALADRTHSRVRAEPRSRRRRHPAAPGDEGAAELDPLVLHES